MLTRLAVLQDMEHERRFDLYCACGALAREFKASTWFNTKLTFEKDPGVDKGFWDIKCWSCGQPWFGPSFDVLVTMGEWPMTMSDIWEQIKP